MKAVAIALMALVALGPAAAPAVAGGTKIIISSSGGFHSGQQVRGHSFNNVHGRQIRGHSFNNAQGHQVRGHSFNNAQGHQINKHHFVNKHHFGGGHRFFVPTYVIPSYTRWVPGYWTYQWVPQVYSYHVWVPAHYGASGTWVDGYYAPQTAQTGYYQRLWVEGYWAR